MTNPLDARIYIEIDVEELVPDPRDPRGFSGERVTVDPTRVHCHDDPLSILAACEEADLEEGLPPGTSLELYLEAQKH